jgi:LacI family transcriptional regulator
VLRGIKHYAESRPDWVLIPLDAELQAIQALAESSPEGLIAWAFTNSVMQAVTRLRRPWVNVCGVLPDDGTPRVGTDDFLVGKVAATHLLDLGLKQFGFVGYSHIMSSLQREAGFRSVIDHAGYELSLYHDRYMRHFDTGVSRCVLGGSFLSWLSSLPTPLGLSGYNDSWMLQLSEICRRLDRRVPEDVAMVGVGNDDLVCELARPSLSSVVIPAEQIGYEAAALLGRLMAGVPPPDRPILIAPLRVIVRQSSDILAVRDPDVAAAVRMIQQSDLASIRVEDIVRAVAVSRRTLEQRFRQSLGRGIFEEIQRVRVGRAAAFLVGTDLPLESLAKRAGFSTGVHLSVVFHREMGMSPSKYRRQNRNFGARELTRV